MATCENCGVSFEPKQYARAGKFCSRECYYALGAVGPRKATVKGQRMRKVKDHPLAPPSGIIAVSRLVLFDKIGPGSHPCHWCGTQVTWIAGGGPATPENLLVDHLDWNRHNDDPANLVPSCNHCNAHRTSKGNRKRLGDNEMTVLWSGAPTRAVERVCATCGEKFLIPPSATARGRGRYCSRDCMYNRHRREH